MTTISQALVNAAADLTNAGKSPWATLVLDNVTAVYASRTTAREGNGKVVKLADVTLELVSEDAIEYTADKAANVEVAVASVTPINPAAEVAVVKVVADVRHVSEPLRPTKLVWAIADDMVASAKAANLPVPTRKEVLAECERRGIAFYTARTQYQVWKTMQSNA